MSGEEKNQYGKVIILPSMQLEYSDAKKLIAWGIKLHISPSHSVGF